MDEVDDNNASSNLSPEGHQQKSQTPKRGVRINRNRSSLAKQMKYSNQHNFIPQPKLNVPTEQQSESKFMQKSQSVTRM